MADCVDSEVKTYNYQISTIVTAPASNRGALTGPPDGRGHEAYNEMTNQRVKEHDFARYPATATDHRTLWRFSEQLAAWLSTMNSWVANSFKPNQTKGERAVSCVYTFEIVSYNILMAQQL